MILTVRRGSKCENNWHKLCNTLKNPYLKGFFFWFVYYTYTIRFQTNKLSFGRFAFCRPSLSDLTARLNIYLFKPFERLNWFIQLL